MFYLHLLILSCGILCQAFQVQRSTGKESEIRLTESLLRISLPVFPAIVTSCLIANKERFVVGNRVDEEIFVMRDDGSFKKTIITPSFTEVKGMACNGRGQMFVLLWGLYTRKCKIFQYDVIKDNLFMPETLQKKEIPVGLCKHSKGLNIMDDIIFMAGADDPNAWLKFSSLDSIDPTLETRMQLTSDRYVRNLGQWAVIDHKIFVAGTQTSIIMLNEDGKFVDEIKLKEVLVKTGFTGDVNSPYIATVGDGSLLLLVSGKKSTKSFVIHVRYEPHGFIATSPKILLTTKYSYRMVLLEAAGGKLLLFFDKFVKLYNIQQ